MAEGQVYNVPEAAFPWFKEKMDRLGKRASKLVGEKLSLMVIGKHFTEADERGHKTRMFEVFVACPEVKINGWQFVARIDHSQEAGNILRIVPGQTLPERFRNSTPECEHCAYKRRRRDTFVVCEEATGEHKQIGSGCLRDFTGHMGADKWAKLAELVAEIGNIHRASYEHGAQGDLSDHRYIDLEAYAGYVAQSVLRDGWISKGVAKETGRMSTHFRAEGDYHNHEEVSDEAKALAARAIEWAQNLEGDLNDYEHNVHVIASSGAIEPRHMGIATSIIGVYWSKNEKPQQPFTRRPDFHRGTHQGQPGDKLTLEVVVHAVYPGANSNRHMFYDANDNLYVWFATKESLGKLKGQKVTIQCSVKTHSEYNGVKQTLINRVKVV